VATCAQWQDAVSARLDGEDPGIPAGALDAHLATCARCRSFAARIDPLDRLVHASAHDVPDRSADILSAVRGNRRARPGATPGADLVPRVALGLVGVLQLVASLPYLWSLTDAHAARDLAAFQLALAIGFLVAAARPATATGLLPTAVALVAVLAVVVAGDITAGRVAAGAETIHLPEVVGVALLWLLATRHRAPRRIHAA
jgi:predicted anti-sigma-YlaC factor YlaD